MITSPPYVRALQVNRKWAGGWWITRYAREHRHCAWSRCVHERCANPAARDGSDCSNCQTMSAFARIHQLHPHLGDTRLLLSTTLPSDPCTGIYVWSLGWLLLLCQDVVVNFPFALPAIKKACKSRPLLSQHVSDLYAAMGLLHGQRRRSWLSQAQRFAAAPASAATIACSAKGSMTANPFLVGCVPSDDKPTRIAPVRVAIAS